MIEKYFEKKQIIKTIFRCTYSLYLDWYKLIVELYWHIFSECTIFDIYFFCYYRFKWCAHLTAWRKEEKGKKADVSWCNQRKMNKYTSKESNKRCSFARYILTINFHLWFINTILIAMNLPRIGKPAPSFSWKTVLDEKVFNLSSSDY